MTGYSTRNRSIFPPVGWLAVGYLGLALLSIVGARSPYLGLVEMSRQLKFFIVFLFAVNCLDSKSVVRVLAIVCVITLAVQAGVTVLRVKTGYYTPIVFGDFHQDIDEIKHYLMVDRSNPRLDRTGVWHAGFPGRNRASVHADDPVCAVSLCPEHDV